MSIKIHYATLYVADQERSLEFYTKALGFEKRRDDTMGPGQRWLEVAPPGAETTVLLYLPTEENPGARTAAEARSRIGTFSGIGLTTDDMDEMFARLKSHGAAIIEEPKDQPWGRQGIFADPDGNFFVVTQ